MRLSTPVMMLKLVCLSLQRPHPPKEHQWHHPLAFGVGSSALNFNHGHPTPPARPQPQAISHFSGQAPEVQVATASREQTRFRQQTSNPTVRANRMQRLIGTEPLSPDTIAGIKETLATLDIDPYSIRGRGPHACNAIVEAIRQYVHIKMTDVCRFFIEQLNMTEDELFAIENARKRLLKMSARHVEIEEKGDYAYLNRRLPSGKMDRINEELKLKGVSTGRIEENKEDLEEVEKYTRIYIFDYRGIPSPDRVRLLNRFLIKPCGFKPKQIKTMDMYRAVALGRTVKELSEGSRTVSAKKRSATTQLHTYDNEEDVKSDYAPLLADLEREGEDSNLYHLTPPPDTIVHQPQPSAGPSQAWSQVPSASLNAHNRGQNHAISHNGYFQSMMQDPYYPYANTTSGQSASYHPLSIPSWHPISTNPPRSHYDKQQPSSSSNDTPAINLDDPIRTDFPDFLPSIYGHHDEIGPQDSYADRSGYFSYSKKRRG